MTTLTYLTAQHNPSALPIDKAVIWLHGLGASGDDFLEIVPLLGLAKDLAVRFVFPNAPSIPITINGGMVMPAWYDILSMDFERKIDIDHIQHSSQAIKELINEQMDLGIPSQNIILAGFSQGGAVAYHTALTCQYQLAGLLALSTYLATEAYLPTPLFDTNINVQIHHGMYDNVVPMSLGVKACQSLQHLGLSPVFKSYPAMHHLVNQQINDIGQWINEIYQKNPKNA